MTLEDFIGTHVIHTVMERTMAPLKFLIVRRADGEDPGELIITATSLMCPAGSFKIAGSRKMKEDAGLRIDFAGYPDPVQCAVFRCGPYAPGNRFGLMIRTENRQIDYVFEVGSA